MAGWSGLVLIFVLMILGSTANTQNNGMRMFIGSLNDVASILKDDYTSHNQDPMKQVLFEPYSLTPRIEHARRVGKPRAHWLIETYADAYKAAGMLEQFDMENIQHRNVIHDMAMQRTGIFQ